MTPFSLTFTDQTPERLDKFLLRHHAEILAPSRSQIKVLIESGAVQVNGKVQKKQGALLKVGAVVSVDTHAAHQRSAPLVAYDFPLPILFEDESLIVINKPAGISMHPGAGDRSKTVVNALLSRLAGGAEGEDRPGVVHRLDKDTTGIVVLAKSAAAHTHLAKQFAERSVDREYCALLLSTPRRLRRIDREDTGVFESQIARDTRDRKKMAVTGGEEGKFARTTWTVQERFPYATLVSLKLGTGRTHQIRVHMNHLNSPVMGDKTYGNFAALPRELRSAADAFGRQALHARSLAFNHPVTGARLTFTSELPADFTRLIEEFRTWQPK